MKPIYAIDAWFAGLMDEVGFFLQSRVGIPRFFLVPLLTLIALLAIYYRKTGSEPTLIDAAFTVVTFCGVLSIHFFEIHKRGKDTPDMQVNIAVEGVRNNPIFLTARIMGVFMFMGILISSLIAFPWQVPIAIIEYLFLWYPCMIYQHPLPPKKKLRSIVKSEAANPPLARAANQDQPMEPSCAEADRATRRKA